MNNNFLERINFSPWWLAALSPFVYLGLGLLCGWWVWAWVIVPVSIICCLKVSIYIKAALIAPFAYLLMALWFRWWTQPWAWFAIPVTLIAAVANAKRPKGFKSYSERGNENAN